ncbi:MAG: acyl-CoA synthetase [Crocinitomicaceae bacterium]|nr:acyl-CoA synthetase [Crocinitomicaceae bacterium]MBT6515185.1 acyl-CoA synthetase [Crocinitomicaceae bacterium]
MGRTDRFAFKGIASKEDIAKIEANSELSSCPKTTYDSALQSCQDNPNETALSFFMLGKDFKSPFTFTYSEMLAEINAAANMLRSLGVEKGDVVGIILPNLPETCFAMVAAQTVGISFTINPLLEKELLKELLLASNVKVLITLGPFVKTNIWEKVNAIRLEVPSIKHVIKVNMTPYLQGWKKSVVGLITQFKNQGTSAEEQKLHDYEHLKEQFSKDKLSFTFDVHSSDAAAYFHTGGTTGRPKIAIQTQDNICFDCWSTGHNLRTGEEEFTVYGGLPLFHVFGAMVMLSMCIAGSGHLVLAGPKGFRGDGIMANFWKTIRHYEITVIAAVPAIYNSLLDISSGEDCTGINYAISGAAPLPVEVMRTFEKRTGVEILEGYGCTEGTCMVAVNPPYGERKIGSVGYPIPYSEIKILRQDSQSNYLELASNEVGSVCIKGRNVFKGYLEEEDNAKVWVDFNGENYFNTGDLGKIDNDGYLWLTGRKKELIIRGGHNIDPASIEAAFYAHPFVDLAAAVGRPDPKVGEVPVVYVQVKPGKKLNEQGLMEFVREKIFEKAAIPKAIVIIDKMPMTSIDKIFKPKLCMQEIKATCEKELKGFSFQSIDVFNSKSVGFTAMIKGVSLSDHDTIKASMSKYSFSLELQQ